MEIRNSDIVVTGGSRGVGEALAREAALRGARVTVLARASQALQEVAGEIGGSAVAVDLSAPQDIASLIPKIEQAQGPIDILVNNAAITLGGPFTAQTVDTVRLQLDTNLAAPIELTRQVLPGMLERNRGGIVMVSSAGAEFAVRNIAVYTASKAGLNHFTMNLQRELRRTPIRTMVVLLGEVNTQMRAENSKDPVVAAVVRRFSYMGSLEPEFVATRVLDGLERNRRSVVLPPVMTPMYQLRQFPSRMMDGLLAGIG